MLTKNPVVKGEPSTFTLTKATLVAHPSLAGDTFYQDTTNWKEVHLVYKSTVGNQPEVVKFTDLSGANPTGTFDVSEKARDAFEIQAILIYDFDGGYKFIPRSSLTIATFDVGASAAGGGGSTSIVWNRVNSTNVLIYGTEGGLELSNPDNNSWAQGFKSTVVAGDFLLQYKTTPSATGNIMLGYAHSDIDMSNALAIFSSDSYVIYLDGNTLIAKYGGPSWVNNPSGSWSANTQYTITMTRVGGLITYTVTGGATNISGTIESNYTGSIYPIGTIYSRARLDSASV